MLAERCGSPQRYPDPDSPRGSWRTGVVARDARAHAQPRCRSARRARPAAEQAARGGPCLRRTRRRPRAGSWRRAQAPGLHAPARRQPTPTAGRLAHAPARAGRPCLRHLRRLVHRSWRRSGRRTSRARVGARLLPVRACSGARPLCPDAEPRRCTCTPGRRITRRCTCGRGRAVRGRSGAAVGVRARLRQRLPRERQGRRPTEARC